MAYKVIKGKNKIRGEQTFVDNITGSVISASAYYGVTFTGQTVSGATGLFTSLTSSVVSASNFYGTNANITTISGSTITGSTGLFTTITGSTITGSTLLSTNITGNYAQLINLSGTTAQYTTITGSQITGSNIKTTTLSASYISASQIALTEYLDFNTAGTIPAYRQGRFYYNIDTQDPAFYTSVTGVNINLGQQTAVKVKNSSGVTITKGKLVHIVGGAGANPLIATASWENDNNSANTLGMAMNDMNQNDFGFVLLNGVIEGIDTQGYTAGQIVYLSSSGNYTGTKPQAPLHAVKVGEVIRVQQNNGSIFVNIANGQEIEELHDVRVTSASAGDLLTYSSYNGTPVWVNTKTLSGSYVITGSLTISSSATFTNIGPAIFSGTVNANNNLSGTTAQFTTITATSITGSTVSGTTGLFTNLTSSVVSASAIYATTYLNLSSSINTGSLLLTASVANSTLTFTKGDGSTFPLTINNVVNATSSSYASNADLFDNRDSTTFAGTGSNTFVGNQIISGNVDITGIVTANELHITYTTSSVIYTSGSTKFGDSLDDTHQFTGSVLAGIVSGTNATFNTFTGSLFGTASYATNAQTASYYNTSNLLTTASVSNATITFTKGDASTFPITINNVVNAQTASYVLNAVSSSYASYANNANALDGYNSTDFAILNTNNIFTADQLLVQSALTLSNGYIFGTALDKPSLVLAAVNSRYFNYVYTRHKNASAVDNAIDFYTSDGTQFGTFPTNAIHGMTITNGKVGVKTTSPSYELDVNGNANITGSLIITGSVITNTGFTGSLYGTASYATLAQNSLTASYIQTAVSATYAANADLLDGRDSTTFAGTGSNTFNGNQIITGSITATSTVSGATGLFTTITSSQSLVSNIMSVGNYVQYLPVSTQLPTNQTASYIYTSGSTNDLYFTQYQPGTSFTNTTRLRWLEGGLSSGLLNGGLLSTVTGTTTFNVSSGSGIIVTYNASTTTDPYPTIKYVQWNNFVSQSLIYSASAPATFIAIDENGAIVQTNIAFTTSQFKDRIVIGRVLHQTGSVTDGTIATPTTAYGISSNTQDFFRACGPVKVSGQILAASGSTLGITRTAGDSYVEGRNYSANPNIPNYILAADDPALTTTKIYYQWVSGSATNIDTNGGVGYSAIRPAFYNNNGTVTAISPTNNKFTVQRVYWLPKSPTRAFYVSYGSTIYTSLSDAIDAIPNEPNYVEGDVTRLSAVYLGAIALEANTSDLTITTKAKIVNGGLFRGTGGGGGGGGGGTTSPGGVTYSLQYNDSGVFNGSANLTFNTTTLTLTGSFNMVGTGSIDIDGGYITGSRAIFTTVSGSTVTGSTALFTTITGSTITGSTGLFTSTTTSTSTIGTALYTSKTTTTVVGNNPIYNIATASYDGMFVDYTARSGSNARAGQIMAIWSGSSVNYTETTTNDFGTTTGLAMAVVINGTNMQLSASASTANWTVKSIIRTI